MVKLVFLLIGVVTGFLIASVLYAAKRADEQSAEDFWKRKR